MKVVDILLETCEILHLTDAKNLLKTATADNETEILIEGRHDICLCPRIIPVVEAMSAITLLDLFLQNKCSNFYTEEGISKLWKTKKQKMLWLWKRKFY